MTKTATILTAAVLITVFSSCSRKHIQETTERVTTTIDTAVVIPPSILDGAIPLPKLIIPQTIENDRVKITLLHDTIYNTINVNSIVKTDTIYVQKTEIIERVASEIKKQPNRSNWWKWLLAGVGITILFRFIKRVYVYTNFPQRPRF